MSYFYSPTLPNIGGFKILLLLEIFIFIFIFLFFVFLCYYFIFLFRKKNYFFYQLNSLMQNSSQLQKQILVDKIKKSEGRQFILLFLKYIETYLLDSSYTSLKDLLMKQGFSLKEVQDILNVLYKKQDLHKSLKNKILKKYNFDL